ncbi:MAG: SUMF1/EgtB/PvdO family nonheme iron enzyme [Armatimonadota bacterium]
MSVRFFRFPIALLLTGILLIASTARAQHSPPTGAGAGTRADAVSIDPDVGDLKLLIESVAPYSTWKHHVAQKPEEALVQVRYKEAGAGTHTTATGLVVRCDGFVLVPRGVRDTARNGGSVQVTLPQVDGPGRSDKSAPTAVTVAARNHRFTHATVPYAFVKTSGYHARSLPLLHSANVSIGEPVRLLWFVPGDNGAAAVIQSRSSVVGPATAAKDTFSIAPAPGSSESVPFGAIVIDQASGAALGMVTQEGTHPAFITFARFQVISSEVGLAPDRAAVRLGDRSGTLPSGTGEMVWVPGGPVPLDGNVASEHLRDYGTTVVCTPGFWMAVQPVTNGEYRRWLGIQSTQSTQSTRSTQSTQSTRSTRSTQTQILRPLPFGWKPGDVQGATGRREDHPAVGMMADDAASFAASRRSRLPTEVEWRRAAYCKDTSWVEEMNQDWDRAGQQVAQLFERQQRQVAELMARAEEATRQRLPPPTERRWVQTKGGSSRFVPGSRAPVVRSNSRTGIVLAPSPGMIEAGLSIQEFTQEFLKGQWHWGQVSPVDSFRQDKSIFGVRNVLINAPEYVQGSTQQTQFAPKRFPAQVDPDLSQFYWGEASSPKIERVGGWGFHFTKTGKIDYQEEYRTRSDDTQQLASAEVLRRMLMSSFMIRYWRGGEASWSGVVSLIGDVTMTTRTYHQGEPIETLPDQTNLSYKTMSIRAGFRTDVRAGFRCAR